MDIEGFVQRYKGLAPLTIKAYEDTLRQLDAFIGDEDEPRDESVRVFLENFKNANYLQRHKAAIKRYYTYKGRLWPFDRMEFPRPRKKIPRGTTRENIEKILEAAHDEHEYMAIKTLFMLGCRIAELRLLDRSRLIENPGERPGVLILGKRNKERFVPVVDKTYWDELKKYAATRGSEPLFPESYLYYRNLLRRMCEDTEDVPILTPHQLRHSRAIELYNKGMKLNELQQFLGHENPSTTMGYLRVSSSEVGDALERVGG